MPLGLYYVTHGRDHILGSLEGLAVTVLANEQRSQLRTCDNADSEAVSGWSSRTSTLNEVLSNELLFLLLLAPLSMDGRRYSALASIQMLS